MLQRLVLGLPAALYARVMRWRRRLYQTGKLRRIRVDVPVVSVGNLAVGGTGKTPLVMALAKRYLRAGLRPAILSRGYRRHSRGLRLVADGRSICATVREAGDEALMMAAEVPGAIVVVAEDRAAGASWLVDRFHPDVILLDDGFQHLRLERQFDLVVLDATTPLARLEPLPLGRLREPLDALAAADLVLVTRSHLPHDQVNLRRLVRRHAGGVPVVELRQRWVGLRGIDGQLHDLQRLVGQPVVAMSGIGNPAAFDADLRQLGARVVASHRFRDHHPYRWRDLEAVERRRRELDASAIVTTVKDLVRMPERAHALPLLALCIEVRLPDSDEPWDRLLALAREPVESQM